MVSSNFAKGIEAVVLVDGKPLPEYNCEEPEDFQDEPGTKRICKYVEVVPGTKFEILVTFKPEYRLGKGMSGISCVGVVDGVDCFRRVARKKQWAKQACTYANQGFEKNNIASLQVQPIRFATLETCPSLIELGY
jgi:hypothetical protein